MILYNEVSRKGINWQPQEVFMGIQLVGRRFKDIGVSVREYTEYSHKHGVNKANDYMQRLRTHLVDPSLPVEGLL